MIPEVSIERPSFLWRSFEKHTFSSVTWTQHEIHKTGATLISRRIQTEFSVCGASLLWTEKTPPPPSSPQCRPRPDTRLFTSLSFDCKGLFTFPYRDSIYSIFVLTLFCNAENWRTEGTRHTESPHSELVCKGTDKNMKNLLTRGKLPAVLWNFSFLLLQPRGGLIAVSVRDRVWNSSD